MLVMYCQGSLWLMVTYGNASLTSTVKETSQDVVSWKEKLTTVQRVGALPQPSGTDIK